MGEQYPQGANEGLCTNLPASSLNMTQLDLLKNLLIWLCHFADGETEAERRKETHPRLCSSSLAGLWLALVLV